MNQPSSHPLWLPETTLNQGYQIMGRFYKNMHYEPPTLLFRDLLEIKKIDTEIKRPQLEVIMMNPGSSFPYSLPHESSKGPAIERDCRAEVEETKGRFPTWPDNTQYQVMRVMSAVGIEFARITNLSDACLSDQVSLKDFLQNNRLDFGHCLYERGDYELAEGAPVLCAWGVDDFLEQMIEKAISKIGARKMVGLLKPGQPFRYYHPFPRVDPTNRKIEWLESVVKQLK
ncbi:MAG: hypothetical protein HN509_11330 [Halobacteriovoraceae bacterium]|jgi:hypothetical protein|nr:hypothetical protein [Halobacteriovoraceae bacterium]MBT5093155.1 hypothetical protein [Halobacteriovoraceae bacterium]